MVKVIQLKQNSNPLEIGIEKRLIGSDEDLATSDAFGNIWHLPATKKSCENEVKTLKSVVMKLMNQTKCHVGFLTYCKNTVKTCQKSSPSALGRGGHHNQQWKLPTHISMENTLI